jgi:hypothetical protein
MKSPLSIQSIEDRLITINGQPVLIDRDVAQLYGVATRDINKAVKNNPDKFPKKYTIALTASEKKELVENFHHPTFEICQNNTQGVYRERTLYAGNYTKKQAGYRSYLFDY